MDGLTGGRGVELACRCPQRIPNETLHPRAPPRGAVSARIGSTAEVADSRPESGRGI